MSLANLRQREGNRREGVATPPERKKYQEVDEVEDEDEEDDEDPKMTKANKAKKLASGKRADQNRKAQRAFRQRKDKYIKDLELRSQELDIANSLIVQLKEENDRLNEIAKSFHSRVNELEGQLARMSSQSGSNVRRLSDQYTPGSPQPEEQYYTQRRGPSRNQSQQFEPGHHAGSVYSQSQGLI